jgi:VWFA-related protein
MRSTTMNPTGPRDLFVYRRRKGVTMSPHGPEVIMARHTAATFTFCVLVTVIAAAVATTAERQFRAQIDVVAIDVAVTDRGRSVTSLGEDDFELRDNGVVQTILDFRAETLPLDVTAAIDLSGSMDEQRRRAVERAVTRLSSALRPDDVGSVLPFSAVVGSRSLPQAPPITVDIRSMGRGTAVLDALLVLLKQPPPAMARAFNLVMSDGEDNASSSRPELALEAAKSSRGQASFVLLQRQLPSDSSFEKIRTRRNQTIATMRSVAELTGGEVYALDTDERLGDAFATAVERFRAGYTLRYTPTGVNRSGWHEVTVNLKGGTHLVRARPGYFVP